MGGAGEKQPTITTAHSDRACTYLHTNGSVLPIVTEISPRAALMSKTARQMIELMI